VVRHYLGEDEVGVVRVMGSRLIALLNPGETMMTLPTQIAYVPEDRAAIAPLTLCRYLKRSCRLTAAANTRCLSR
jgi:hypothetical protein